MAQISPKQIDWSQSISGSLIPFVSGAATSSVYSLGTPSASWATAYIDQLDVSNISIDQIDLDNLELQTLIVNQDTQLKNNTEITGSLNISGSITLDGDLTIEGLGTLGNRDDDNVMDLGGFF
jgi:hypothetical protein